MGWRSAQLRLHLVVDGQIQLGQTWNWERVGWYWRGYRKVVTDGLETVFTGGVGDGFSLAVRVDVGVRSFAVALGVSLLVEFNAVFLRVRRTELAGGVQVSGFLDDGRFVRWLLGQRGANADQQYL